MSVQHSPTKPLTLNPIICKSNYQDTENKHKHNYNNNVKKLCYDFLMTEIEKGILIPNIPDISSDPKYNLDNLDLEIKYIHICYICEITKGIKTKIKHSKSSICLECYNEILGFEASQYDKSIKQMKFMDNKLSEYYYNKKKEEDCYELFILDKQYCNLLYNLKNPKKCK